MLETHSNDPLGECPRGREQPLVEEGDDELEPLPEGVNELSDDEWWEAAELAWLYYREAETFADAIPETLALVTE